MPQRQTVTPHAQQQAVASYALRARNTLTAREVSAVRYAIYYAPPPDSAWWHFACAWIGRDPVTDAPVVRPPVATLDATYLAHITALPRRYGFHATLKAPFRLAPEYTARDVYLQAANLASSWMTAQLPPLTLRAMGSSTNCATDLFIALGFAPDQAGACPAHALAAQCVSCFDNLRARPDAVELARRHAAGLTPRQMTLLAEWGYPFVFDEFRFHLTLTGHLPPQEIEKLLQTLSPMIDALNAKPLQLDAISVFVQPEPDAPFVVTRRYGFDGSIEIYREDP
jgi:putative phosphonate metabolism protein